MEKTQVNASAQDGLTEYTVIEDCSPFYIKFSFPGKDKLVNVFRTQIKNIPPDADPNEIPDFAKHRSPKFKPIPVDERVVEFVRKEIPFWNDFDFDMPRFVVSEPGLKFPIHRDSAFDHAGINFLVEVLDDKCLTNWYSEESVAHLTPRSPQLGLYPTFLEISDNEPKPIPIKTVIFEPGDCIVINTDIWHDWDNSQSTNRRINILLRGLKGSPTFEEIRKKLFGY